MVDAEAISTLIGQIYDAALDPAYWPAALHSAACFVGGQSASLFVKDATGGQGGVYFQDGGIPQQYVDLYFDRYAGLDPLTTRQFFGDVEQVFATADILPYDEFVETRFYLEWARPQALVDHLSAILDKSGTSMSLFGVFRHERDGLADDASRQRMQLIVPHVRRAVLIGQVIERNTQKAAALTHTLDRISAGMFLVDARGDIAHANAAGHGLLTSSGMLRGAGGRLTAADPATDRLLHDIFKAAGEGDSAVGVRGIALSLMSRDGDRYVAHVLPLTSGQRRRAGASYAAVAALFVHRAAVDQPAVPEVIAKAFGLTPTELRVLLAVTQIGGAPEVAEALGVGETTVKFHLKRLFEKTGSRRQADLVKVVAGYSAPVSA